MPGKTCETDYELLGYGDYLKPGQYRIHSKFARVSNFVVVDGNALVSLVKKEIGNGPVNIVLEGINFSEADEFRLTSSKIIINDFRVQLANCIKYNSKILWDDINTGNFKTNLAYFKEFIVRKAHPKSFAFLLDTTREKSFKTSFEKELVKRIKKGFREFLEHRYIEGVKLIKGAGFGLTPSGDDFIAGFLSGMYLISKIYNTDLSEIQETVYTESISGNIISNTFIYFAKEGLFFEKIKNLILSLINGNEETVSSNAEKMLLIGETSGADFSAGLICSFKNFSP